MTIEYPGIPFTTYLTSTGQILHTGAMPSMAMVNAQTLTSDHSVLALPSNPATQYVVSGVIRDKFPLNASIGSHTVVANGVSTITLNNLPNPTNVRVYVVGIYDTSVVVTGGYLNLTFNVPGQYTIAMTGSFIYLPQTEIINAT